VLDITASPNSTLAPFGRVACPVLRALTNYIPRRTSRPSRASGDLTETLGGVE